MKLNIIYSGLGLSSLSDKPIWQQEAENELFAMIRASGITLSIQYYIDEPCSMQYREWDAGCGWVVHADARTLANTTPQDVFATLIFWKPPAPSIEFPIPCARYDGIAYQTFEIGFDKRPAFVVNAEEWQCDPCTQDFNCVYGYILGHEFYHILEDWVKWKLLLATDTEMPMGDNTELCNNIGLCQGTNPTSCIDTPTCDSTGCAERWGTKGSKPCYQCFFDLYLPEVDRLINEHDEHDEIPVQNNIWVWIAGLGLAALLLKDT